MYIIKFPSLASPCVELVCIHATYQYNTQHAGCEELSAVSLHTDAFVSGLVLDSNEHTRHTSRNLLYIYRMISIPYYLVHVNTNTPRCGVVVFTCTTVVTY